ncbi:MAG TPA: hypothetical protein VKZ95_04405 [Sphingobacteriaceae bacterium]|nr:hypothetical protein [Sphingobacteriaceae bacterium]
MCIYQGMLMSQKEAQGQYRNKKANLLMQYEAQCLERVDFKEKIIFESTPPLIAMPFPKDLLTKYVTRLN